MDPSLEKFIGRKLRVIKAEVTTVDALVGTGEVLDAALMLGSAGKHISQVVKLLVDIGKQTDLNFKEKKKAG